MRAHSGLDRWGYRRQMSILPETVPPRRPALTNGTESATAVLRRHFAKGGR